MSDSRDGPGGVRVAAVVLAAGTSSRWGNGEPKQLAEWRGEALVRRAARTALASGAREVVVVTGHQADRVEGALADLDVRTVHNPDYSTGQASSIRTALRSLGSELDGALFLACDQPLLDASTLDRLLAAFAALRTAPRSHAVVPTRAGRRGSPALIGADLFPRLAVLRGDAGGRQVLAEIPERIVEVELASDAPLRDVDTPAELQALRTELGDAVGNR